MRLSISALYLVVLINIDMTLAQQQQSVKVNGARVYECAQRLNISPDTENLKQMFLNLDHPNGLCARLCVYQALELVDHNFEINKSKFATILKRSGQSIDDSKYKDCLASTQPLKAKICEYATSRVYCFIEKPDIKF